MTTSVFRKKIIAAVFATSALAFTSNALAQDEDESESLVNSVFSGWSGTASLGATSASGNAEASNINGAIRLSKTVNRWEHLVFGSIFRGRSSIVVEERDDQGNVVTGDNGFPNRTIVRGDNSDRIALGYQPKFFYRPNTYFFGILDFEQDEPANLDVASRQVIGVGYRFFANETGFLTGELGFGNKVTNLVVGDDIDGGIGYLGLNFLSNITDTVSFNADLRSDFGSDNTFIELGLGISFKLSDKLALNFSHFTRSNSDLTDDPFVDSSDSVTTMNLVVDI